MAAPMAQVLLQLSRLNLGLQSCRSFVTHTGPLAIRATAALGSEPMKKRKKMDINIVINRETKKRRKLEKAIRRLEMKGRKLKPVDEIEGYRHIKKSLDIRQREPAVLSFEEMERRARLQKQWTVNRYVVFTNEMRLVEKALRSQQRALEELRAESEELYQAAIQTDSTLVPLEVNGPVNTPPIAGYEAPDGEYIDTTTEFTR